MGSPPKSSKQLHIVLQREPELVTWSQSREVTLFRGQGGKLGFRLHTFQGKRETFTVVTKVKDECRLNSGRLKVFDRITGINHVEAIYDSEQHILNRLASSSGLLIILTVCHPETLNITRSLKSFDISVSSLNESKPHRYYADPTFNSFTAFSDPTTGAKRNDGGKHVDNNLRTDFSENIGLNDISSSRRDDQEAAVLLRSEASLRRVNSNETLSKADKSNSNDNNNDIEKGENEKRVSNESGISCRTSSEYEKRTSNESGISSQTSLEGEIETDSKHIKRAFSEVSGSSSNQSAGSNQSSTPMHRRDIMRKSKGDKIVKRFYKSSSAENPDTEELEPLHNSTAHTNAPLPPSLGKTNSKYSNFMVEDHSSHSLPIKDNAVSMQDIVFEDHAVSLPVAYGRPVNTPASSHVSSCPCATCLVMAESRVCYNCGTKPGSNPQSPGVSLFTDVSHEQLPDDYGNFLLKNPHLAVWDGKNTHVVEIDKGPNKEIGFSHKVKICKNQDASFEIYTLVKDVEKGGPAKGKLTVGDWIRSVNGTPIQIPDDAFTLINASANVSTLRLVIQRPVGLSQQPQSLRAIEKLDKSPDIKPPSPQPPGCSPVFRDQDPLLASAHLPGIIEPKKGPEKKVLPQNIYFPDNSSVNENNIGAGNTPFPKSAKLPKVKIFLCGSEAEKCAHFILRDSDINAEFPHPGYSYVNYSMATDCFGNVVISSACSNLYSTNSHCGDARCKHCGGEFIKAGSQNALGTVVNVELFVIPDDRLFHTCCNYLFTKSSIFILTFDGAKLLCSASGEFSRLQNLSHTIRSHAGDECHVMSCGLLDCGADTRNMADEVRALFYTPFNTQLQNFSVCGPELVNVQTSVPAADSFSENQQLQVVIWKMITETIQRQRVLHPSLLIIDHLTAARDKDLFLLESQLMDIIKQKLPNYQLDVHQMVLTYLNMNGEIILGKAAPYNIPHVHKIESLVVLNPRALLDHLYTIISIVADEKQNWIRTHSSGFISASNFIDLCPESEKKSQYIADFMESFGLILRKPNTGTNVEYFLPYFAQVPSSTDCPQAGKKDFELLLQFSNNESVQTFFHLVFTLSSRSDSPGSLTVQAMNCCVFQHEGLLVTVYHLKIEDRIKFILHREDNNISLKTGELFTWLYSTCHKALDPLDVHFLLGAPCPLGSTCCGRATLGIHIVDVRETGPQHCGENRIDTLKAIRMWKQKDTEPPATPSPSKSPRGRLVMELGWSLFQMIYVKLKIPSPLGRDWRGLAGLMGYNSEEVQMYETCPEPSKQLLHDWSTSRNATVDDLIKLLEELELDDIVSDVRKSLSLSSSSQNQTSQVQKWGAQSFLEIPTSQKSINTDRGMAIVCEAENETEEEQGRTVKLSNVENNNQVDAFIGQDSRTMTPVETFNHRDSPGSEA